MFLRTHQRRKNGKVHRYFSLVENRRIAGRGPEGRRIAQRTVLYLGEINDSQQAAWRKTLEVVDGTGEQPKQLALFPDDRPLPPDALIDNTTLRDFLKKIEQRYGQARRTW